MEPTARRHWLLCAAFVATSLAAGVAIGVNRRDPAFAKFSATRPVRIHALLKSEESASTASGTRTHILLVTYEVTASVLPAKLVWPPVGVFGYGQWPVQSQGDGAAYWKQAPAILELKPGEVKRFQARIGFTDDPTSSPYFEEFVFGNPGRLPDKEIVVGSVLATCEWAKTPGD